jgi:PPM family protein phosphatase
VNARTPTPIPTAVSMAGSTATSTTPSTSTTTAPPAVATWPVTIAACSRAGMRTHNEDDLRHGQHAGRVFAVLADGAGGHSGGAIASDLTVRTMAACLQRAEHYDAATLTDAACQANAAVLDHSRAANSNRMHATLVALWIDGARSTPHAKRDMQASHTPTGQAANVPAGQAQTTTPARGARTRALWAHVGDSRLYHLRGGRIHSVTRDDSVVQQLVDAGLLQAHQAHDHPAKHQLVGAMGMEPPLDPHTTTVELPLNDGDAFLLCSDGWWEATTDADIEGCLQRASSVADWIDRMAAVVTAHADAHQDNYSAVGVWVGDPALVTRAL